MFWPIDTLGEPHRRHPAFAELTQQAVRSDELAAAVRRRAQLREVAGFDLRQRLQQILTSALRIRMR
jgi:hypothetical protein